jgi:hypothetical protein
VRFECADPLDEVPPIVMPAMADRAEAGWDAAGGDADAPADAIG